MEGIAQNEVSGCHENVNQVLSTDMNAFRLAAQHFQDGRLRGGGAHPWLTPTSGGLLLLSTSDWPPSHLEPGLCTYCSYPSTRACFHAKLGRRVA